MNLTGYCHLVLVTHIIHFWVIVSVAVNLFTSLNPLLSCSPSHVVAPRATTTLEMDNWLLLKLPMLIADNCTRNVVSLIFKLRVIISLCVDFLEQTYPTLGSYPAIWLVAPLTSISSMFTGSLLKLSVFSTNYRHETISRNVIFYQWIVIGIPMSISPSF